MYITYIRISGARRRVARTPNGTCSCSPLLAPELAAEQTVRDGTEARFRRAQKKRAWRDDGIEYVEDIHTIAGSQAQCFRI